MRRRSYVHTYVSDIQTIHNHTKPVSNTKNPSTQRRSSQSMLTSCFQYLEYAKLFFFGHLESTSEDRADACKMPSRIIHPSGRSVGRAIPPRTLERARTAQPPCLPFSPPLCPPRRPPRYVSLDSIPPRIHPVRSRVYPRHLEPRSTPRPSSTVGRRARRAAMRDARARARRKIYIRVHRRAAPRVVRRARRRRDHPLGSDRSDALDRRVV